jgi:hypothetical protein
MMETLGEDSVRRGVEGDRVGLLAARSVEAEEVGDDVLVAPEMLRREAVVAPHDECSQLTGHEQMSFVRDRRGWEFG